MYISSGEKCARGREKFHPDATMIEERASISVLPRDGPVVLLVQISRYLDKIQGPDRKVCQQADAHQSSGGIARSIINKRCRVYRPFRHQLH
mmetsp:Transcript_23509/g.50023  ORF Transcript_23509/g.50023 Transcript_23509/m.50023 type:complete len:92 (+) Transcript_23509:817-1092(+)